jgi:hypothetical protein
MRLFESASRNSDPAIDEERFLRAARAYALKRFPNPERKGCPPAAEIDAIARHQISLAGIGDRARHIATCSPCLRDYLDARDRWKRRRRRVIAVLAAAAGLAVVIAGASFLAPPAPVSPSPPRSVAEQSPADAQRFATLDLRPLEPSRGDAETRAAPPVLPRASLKLTVLLPVGSEPGNYEFEVRDQQDSPEIRGAAIAVIRKYVTTIETSLDLRQVDPGSFRWAIRRVGETSWRSYPLEVR